MKLKSLCDETMILQSISENAKGTKLSNEKPQAFFKSIASIPAEVEVSGKNFELFYSNRWKYGTRLDTL